MTEKTWESMNALSGKGFLGIISTAQNRKNLCTAITHVHYLFSLLQNNKKNIPQIKKCFAVKFE